MTGQAAPAEPGGQGVDAPAVPGQQAVGAQAATGERTVAALAALVEGRVRGDAQRRIDGVASLERADPSQLTFVTGERHAQALARTRAGAVLMREALLDKVPDACVAILVRDPYAAFARIAQAFARMHAVVPPPGTDPAATVAADAIVPASAHVGARAVIESGAEIGERCTIGPGCVIGRGARIGHDSMLVANVTVYHGCIVGARCIVHAGAVIGADGFGFAPEGGRWLKIPQTGRAVIGDDVEIGANTTIDRGALDDTVIGDGCKIDNLVQIGHNVQVGAHSVLAGCAGVAGSARIGAHCMIGGGAGLVGHIELCDAVVVGGMTMVTRSISEPGFYTGAFPLMTNRDWERAAVGVRQLDGLRRRVKALERAMPPAANPASDEDSPP